MLWMAIGILLSGCSASDRLSKIFAPQPLARSAGGSYATTDSYLSTLEIPNPSETVLATLSKLPEEDAMVFIAKGREPQTELTYRTIAYLGWPRQIAALHCGSTGESPTLLFKPQDGKKIRWMIFYRIEPPADSSSQVFIGDNLKLIPIEEVKEWTSYCSQ